jgi:hypothetical protein
MRDSALHSKSPAAKQAPGKGTAQPSRARNAQTPAGAEGWMRSGEIWLAGVPGMWGLPCLNYTVHKVHTTTRGDWGVRMVLQRAARKLESKKEEVPPVGETTTPFRT